MVTIAIPFYNAEKYLVDAIKSVFAQTYTKWELILIDDGSTDNSLAIAQSIKDPRVRVYSDGKNKRLAARLNEVTNLAKYDYIARMDADDLMMPYRIEKQLEILTNNDVDIVTTGVYSILNNLDIVGIRGTNYEAVNFKDLLSRKVGIIHAAIIAKKSWYQRNMYDESLSIAQDLDLWLRTSKKNDLKIISIAESLYIYREEDNITKKKLIKAYKNERNMIRKYCDTSFNIKILKLYVKTLVVLSLDIVGKIDLLQKNRVNSVITPQKVTLYKEAIVKIKNTKVSGIDA